MVCGLQPYLLDCTGTGSSFHWEGRVAPVSLQHTSLSSRRASAGDGIFSASCEDHTTVKIQEQAESERNSCLFIHWMCLSGYIEAHVQHLQGRDYWREYETEYLENKIIMGFNVSSFWFFYLTTLSCSTLWWIIRHVGAIFTHWTHSVLSNPFDM